MRQSGARPLPGMVRFETIRRARWRPHQVVAGFYVVFVFFAHHAGSVGWVEEAGWALLAFTLYAGFGVDRQLAYDQLVTSNWVGAWTYIGGKLLSLALALLAMALVVFGSVLAASAGAFGEAAWHALVFVLAAAYLLPLILVAEMGMESRVPAVAALPLFALVAALIAWFFGPEAVTGWLVGSAPEAHRLETTGPFAARALGISLPLAGGVVLLFRRRLGGPAG